MKKIIAGGLTVCYARCVPPSEKDYLTSFEKNCVGKCSETYVENFLLAQNNIMNSMPTEPAHDHDF